MKKAETRYCSKCGAKLDAFKVGAEDFYYLTPAGKIYPYTAYNKKTGKRQYVYRYLCPEKRWYNEHDDYMVDKVYSF